MAAAGPDTQSHYSVYFVNYDLFKNYRRARSLSLDLLVASLGDSLSKYQTIVGVNPSSRVIRSVK